MVVLLPLLPVLVEVAEFVSVASRLVSPTKPIASLPPFFRPELCLELAIPETSRPSRRLSRSLSSVAPLFGLLRVLVGLYRAVFSRMPEVAVILVVKLNFFCRCWVIKPSIGQNFSYFIFIVNLLPTLSVAVFLGLT